MFSFTFTATFIRSQKRLVKSDEKLNKRLKIALQKLSVDPSHSSLNSHKVDTKDHGLRWSSRVTGDIRVIWDYDNDERLIIILLDLGGHSGKRSVY